MGLLWLSPVGSLVGLSVRIMAEKKNIVSSINPYVFCISCHMQNHFNFELKNESISF
jgi:nitrate/TMAO reductase-like tetraheme cytochrome c subunit